MTSAIEENALHLSAFGAIAQLPVGFVPKSKIEQVPSWATNLNAHDPRWMLTSDELSSLSDYVPVQTLEGRWMTVGGWKSNHVDEWWPGGHYLPLCVAESQLVPAPSPPPPAPAAPRPDAKTNSTPSSPAVPSSAAATADKKTEVLDDPKSRSRNDDALPAGFVPKSKTLGLEIGKRICRDGSVVWLLTRKELEALGDGVRVGNGLCSTMTVGEWKKWYGGRRQEDDETLGVGVLESQLVSVTAPPPSAPPAPMPLASPPAAPQTKRLAVSFVVETSDVDLARAWLDAFVRDHCEIVTQSSSGQVRVCDYRVDVP